MLSQKEKLLIAILDRRVNRVSRNSMCEQNMSEE